MYLASDSAGATADFVRWRIAVGTNDASMLRQIRARFNSLDLATLSQIVTASQMTGDALEDAERASTLIIDRTTHPADHVSALYWGHMLALNRGRPHQADSLLRSRHEIDTSPYFFQAVTTWAALYGDGARLNPADRLYLRRLTARDGWGRATRPVTRLAFYVRSHWLRMPPTMLVRHLWIKWRKAPKS